MTDIPQVISLYIHIPFCVRKCRYCDFYSIPYDTDEAGRFVRALASEWELVKKELCLEAAEIRTIFIGGGTPSMLSMEQWELINTLLVKNLPRSPDCEWSLECNPDSFTEEKALLWHSMGVTRLTFGVQSINDLELGILGRPHSAAQALAVFESPVLSRFKSIGADLMYGLPGQTVSSFEKSIHTVLSRPVVSHLSAYELTINPHTPLGRHVSKIPFPSEERVLAMAQTLYAQCKAEGFERYEISNFSKQGHRCRHNEAYWDHSPYIGLGPAAHSYIAPQRFANTGNVSRYITDLSLGKRPLEFTEALTTDNLISEMIFLRLRTTDGLDENDFYAKTGQAFYSGRRMAALEELIKGNMIAHTQQWWRLTEQGMFVADAIAKRLV
jgi:oxygen-independent coproporphyrinogen III oxidase